MNLKYFYLIILTTFPSSFIVCQSDTLEIKFSHEIELALAQQTITPSRAGFLYSLIGEYYMANMCSDIPVSWGVDTITESSEYLIKDALEIIKQEASNHDIVIISENHLKIQHRIFAKEIIRELSKLGFNHLGLETFSNKNNGTELLDSLMHERGYPLNNYNSGTYTMEPCMAELVRKALKLNYNLFAYEKSKDMSGERERIQAENIAKYMDKHKDAKLIIICGFHHTIESSRKKYDKYYWMGQQLKSITGKDPLTIYQDNFTEKFIENEHPLLNQLCILKPSVLLNNQGNIISFSDDVDIEVVHPKTRYYFGRPHWRYESENYFPIKVDNHNPKLNYPFLASTYNISEKDGVPVDRIEIKHKFDNKHLVLAPGEYRIVLDDKEIQIEYTIRVKK